MVPAAQMQQTMHEQDAKLLLRRGAEPFGLRAGDIRRDDDVAEQERLFVRHARSLEDVALVERVVHAVALERQDVGRAIDAAELRIQTPDLVVGDEGDARLGALGQAFPAEDVGRKTLDVHG